MSVKMKISLVSWIASTETDLKIGTASPPGTSPWCCISWQRLLLNPLKRPLWNIWPSRLFWVLVNAGVRSMLGKIKISDIKQTGLKGPCTPHPAFFPRTSLPKRVQTVWQQWLYQPWSLLWISHSSLIGPCAQSEHCATIWTQPETLGRIRSWSFSPLRKALTKTSHLPLSPHWSNRLWSCVMSSLNKRPSLYIRLKLMMSGHLLLPRPSNQESNWNKFYQPTFRNHITSSRNFTWRMWLGLIQSSIIWEL